MSESAFDPVAFLSAQQTEVNEKRSLVPAGWYTAFIGGIKPENVKNGTYGKGDRIGQPWLQIRVPLRLQLAGVPNVPAELGAEFIVTDGVFIDLTAAGAVDNGKGKNNRQRIYREAVRMNQPGQPFSWQAMEGRPVKVEVVHKILDDGRIVENVGNILPA